MDPHMRVMKVQQPVFLVGSYNKIIPIHSDQSIGLDMGRLWTCHRLLLPSIPGSNSDLQEAAH